ncbi:MAG: pyridoxal 5'-phosphate synthase glutaminase subunit PdxT [Spirochaetales bacterium]|nr:pyridoxal 5'-phosphate synthase glutaminase subunit PdxT [Spirochaetales bacterium]
MEMLKRAGADISLIRKSEHLEGIDACVIPGGESTTIGKLLVRNNLFKPLKQRIEEGLPVFGTCAGMILLAKDIQQYDQPRFQALDVEVQRNAYGRQVESFEADLSVAVCGEPVVRAVFIRAPLITRIGKTVTVLASFEGSPVLVRQNNILAGSFHPELTDDPRIHQYFISMIP